MATTRDHLHQLVESLPEQEIATAQRFLLFLSQEPIGDAFAQSLRRGITQAEAGQVVACHDYDDMVSKLLDSN